MNKKLLVLLAAALLLVSATACGDKDDPDTDTLPPPVSDDADDTGKDPVTDESGNVVTDEATTPDNETDAGTEAPEEVNPTFTEKSTTVVMMVNGKMHETAELNDGNINGWPVYGDILEVTGESETWYRVKFNEKEGYIKKSVTAPASGLEGFTAISDTVVTNAAANIRTYPSTDSSYEARYIIKESVPAGTKLTRVAKSGEWSRVLYQATGDTEAKEYYIHNACIDEPETVAGTSADTTADTTADTAGDTTPDTTAGTEA